ncbi:MAG TPA: pilus assembly protein [Actinomycetes bacterium]
MTSRTGRFALAPLFRRRLCPAPVDRDAGNAIVEFVYLAVLLMVPLVYVLLTVFRVQSAAFAVSSAAREAGRVYATSDSVDDAGPRAFAAAGIVMADSGLSMSAGDLRITCSTAHCLQPGSRVEVAMTYRVTLPLVPRFFTDRAPASIRVTSHHLEVVDRYRAPAR